MLQEAGVIEQLARNCRIAITHMRDAAMRMQMPQVALPNQADPNAVAKQEFNHYSAMLKQTLDRLRERVPTIQGICQPEPEEAAPQNGQGPRLVTE